MIFSLIVMVQCICAVMSEPNEEMLGASMLPSRTGGCASRLVSRISRAYSGSAMGLVWLLSLDALWRRLWPVLMLLLSIQMEYTALANINAALAHAQREELLMLQAMRDGNAKKKEIAPQVELLTSQIAILHRDYFGPAQRLLTWQVLLTIVLVPTLFYVVDLLCRMQRKTRLDISAKSIGPAAKVVPAEANARRGSMTRDEALVIDYRFANANAIYAGRRRSLRPDQAWMPSYHSDGTPAKLPTSTDDALVEALSEEEVTTPTRTPAPPRGIPQQRRAQQQGSRPPSHAGSRPPSNAGNRPPSHAGNRPPSHASQRGGHERAWASASPSTRGAPPSGGRGK